jgi:hypothetical protein
MAEHIGHSDIHAGNARNARDIRRALEHLARYRDPDKHGPPVP